MSVKGGVQQKLKIGQGCRGESVQNRRNRSVKSNGNMENRRFVGKKWSKIVEMVL